MAAPAAARPAAPPRAVAAGASAARPRGGALAAARVVFAWLLLPNVVLALVARVVAVRRGLVNLDYVLGAVALAFGGPRLARPVVAGLVALDALAALAPVYNFQPADAVLALAEVRELSWRFALPVAAAAAVAGWAAARALVRVSGVRVSRRALAALLLLALGVGAVDALNGTSLVSGDRPVLRSEMNLATSALLQVAGRFVPHPGPASPDAVTPVPSATALAGLAASPAEGRPDVLLVVVESLGSFASGPAATERLFAPLLADAVRARYDVRVGTVPFAGTTTHAEIRELCGASAGSGDIGRLAVASCVPAVLRDAGYETLAVHGHAAATFGRGTWYSRLGFDSAVFAPELTADGFGTRCGFSYRGVCDTTAVAFVHERLRRATRPTFVYWLTLSSHLPVDAETAAATPADCGAIAEAARDRSACLLLRLHSAVVRGLASVLTDPSLRPTRVVIVGDHPPPFLQRTRRELYLQDRVPFVSLTPRRAGDAPARAARPF